MTNDPESGTGAPTPEVLVHAEQSETPDPNPQQPEHQTQPHTLEEIRREFVIVNRTVDVRRRSQELAELQLREEQRRGWNPFRKIKMRIFEEYYRQQYIERATKAMLANNNSYLNMNVVKNAAVQATHKINEERQAGQAKVEQIKTQVASGTEKLGGTDIREAQGALKDALMNQIIRPIVTSAKSQLLVDAQNPNGKIIATYEDVQAALKKFIEQNQGNTDIKALFGEDATQYGKLANYFASDLLEMGQRVKQDLDDHKYALEQLDQVVKIQLANVDWAAETKATFNAADKFIRWAEKRKLTGSIFNPAVIGVGFSLGWYGIMRAAGIGGTLMHVTVPLAGILPGAAFAAIRRNYDLKVDRGAHQIEMAYNSQKPTKEIPRRNALENYAYGVASTDGLLNGRAEPQDERGRRQEVLISDDRRGLRELMQLDLSDGQNTNRDAVIRRVAEIKSRLDFSAQQSIDLITFSAREQVEQGRLELIKGIVEARRALRNAGMDETAISTQETQFIGQWSQAFTQNREQQDRSFRNYRLRNAAGSFGFATIAGFTAGLLTQETWALVGRGVFNQNLGQTVLEQAPGAKGIMEAVHLPTADRGETGREVFKHLYDHPGNLKVNNDLTFAIDANHAGGFLDKSGNLIESPPMHLSPDGKIIASGNTDSLPKAIKDLIGGWDHKPNVDTNYNIHEDIQDMVATQRSGVFQHGNTIISIDGANGTASILDHPSSTSIYGTVNPDGTLTFDVGNPANKGVDWNILDKRFTTETWIVDHQTLTPATGPGSATAIDQLLNQPPDVLRAKGIIETDQFGKNWNFHVLRPDIVNATGMHTHNELTAHVGGTFQVASGEIRTDSGLPGTLNFGGDIKGDLIPSNLPGVPPQHDQILDALIAKNGPIKHSDMLFAVDLTNGKQIMIPADAGGNAKLPPELYDPNTGGLRGVKSIAALILEKNDGTLLKANELMNSGGQIPGGTIVHSLSSEKFAEIELPPPPREIVNLTPPDATEFDPPVTEFESPPIIPIPFAPRHPLEEMLPPPEGPVYYSGGEASPEDKRNYERRRSPRLNTNPKAELDPQEEIQWYLNQQPQEYRQELEQMNVKIGNQMEDECRLSICIAAASHQEGKNIYNTLLQYTNQRDNKGNPLNHNLFEINIFLNRPKKSKPDETASEIERFQKDHPEIKVHAFGKTFPTRPPMGVISKYVADMALIRASQRQNPTHQDLILVNNDADAELISKGYVRALINAYDNREKKHLDAILGKIEWDPESYIKYPGFHVANRFIQYVDTFFKHNPDRRIIGSSGANFSLKASSYAAIGGYIKEHDAGQDVDLSKMIRAARTPKGSRLTREDYPIDYIGGAWLVTNPRRGLSYYTGYNEQDPNIPRRRWNSAVVNQWSDFSSREGVRDSNWLSKQATVETVDTMSIQHLEDDLNITLNIYGLQADSAIVKRILSQFLKIDYQVIEVPDGKGGTTKEIKITDISKLQADLRKYQAEGKNKIDELKNQRITRSSETQTIAPQHIQPIAQPTNIVNRLDSTASSVASRLPGRRSRQGATASTTPAIPPAVAPAPATSPAAPAAEQQSLQSRVAQHLPQPAAVVDRLNAAASSITSRLPHRGSRPNPVTPSGPPATPSAEQPSLPDSLGRSYTLNELFGQVQGPGATGAENPNYFIPNLPDSLQIPNTELNQFESTKPFFVNGRVENGQPKADINSEAAPYTYDLASNQRFVNAEKLTKEDSGLLALAAVSTDTPEKQATLYKDLADAILRIHEHNPSLLETWLHQQEAYRRRVDEVTSLDIFKKNDIDPVSGNPKLESEKLANFLPDQFPRIWQFRINELKTALSNNQFKPQHLRWIEFLSHSTDVTKLIQKAKESSPTGTLRADRTIRITAPEALRQQGTLLERVNRTLETSTSTEARFETTPDDVANFIKTIKLGSGANIEELEPKIDNGKLFIRGKISAKKFGMPVGDANFFIRLENDLRGGITVTPLQLQLTGAVAMKRGEIDNAVSNINTLLINELNKQINRSWEATGFQITQDKLAFDFRKKPNEPTNIRRNQSPPYTPPSQPPVQTQPIVQPEQQQAPTMSTLQRLESQINNITDHLEKTAGGTRNQASAQLNNLVTKYNQTAQAIAGAGKKLNPNDKIVQLGNRLSNLTKAAASKTGQSASQGVAVGTKLKQTLDQYRQAIQERRAQRQNQVPSAAPSDEQIISEQPIQQTEPVDEPTPVSTDQTIIQTASAESEPAEPKPPASPISSQPLVQEELLSQAPSTTPEPESVPDATPSVTLDKTIPLPAHINDSSRDVPFAESFWNRHPESNKEELRQAMIETLETHNEHSLPLPVSISGGTSLTDREMIAAYRELAKELGYELSEFRYNPETNRLLTFVHKLPPEEPAKPIPAPETPPEPTTTSEAPTGAGAQTTPVDQREQLEQVEPESVPDATPSATLEKTIALPSHANDQSLDAPYAGSFWQRYQGSAGADLRHAMIGTFAAFKEHSLPLPASASTLNLKDREMIAAYRQLAKELGYELSEFRYDPDKKQLVTFVHRIPPVETPTEPEEITPTEAEAPVQEAIPEPAVPPIGEEVEQIIPIQELKSNSLDNTIKGINETLTQADEENKSEVALSSEASTFTEFLTGKQFRIGKGLFGANVKIADLTSSAIAGISYQPGEFIDIHGSVDTLNRNITFNLTFAVTSDGKLVPFSVQTTQLPKGLGLLNQHFAQSLSNLGNMLTSAINQTINSGWEVDGYRLSGQASPQDSTHRQLIVDFRKKGSIPPKPKSDDRPIINNLNGFDE